MGGLERVDVILRRVDDIYCDPLELKSDSQLGIPGLLQCVRSGNVSLANPLGCSILENPGLMPFFQQISRYFLNADLISADDCHLVVRPAKGIAICAGQSSIPGHKKNSSESRQAVLLLMAVLFLQAKFRICKSQIRANPCSVCWPGESGNILKSLAD